MEYPVNGKGCVNSEVVFSNTLNDPWILNGASLIDDLNPGELAWSNETLDHNINNNSYEILYKNNTLKPWKLIIKK